MGKELFMLSNKIKELREMRGLTQADIAKSIGLTRSSVNAWEMGLSVPSTPYIVELAKLFEVSTDYLLGLEKTASLDISGLDEKDVALVSELIKRLKNKPASR